MSCTVLCNASSRLAGSDSRRLTARVGEILTSAALLACTLFRSLRPHVCPLGDSPRAVSVPAFLLYIPLSSHTHTHDHTHTHTHTQAHTQSHTLPSRSLSLSLPSSHVGVSARSPALSRCEPGLYAAVAAAASFGDSTRSLSVCTHVCVCACVRVHACVCVCVVASVAPRRRRCHHPSMRHSGGHGGGAQGGGDGVV